MGHYQKLFEKLKNNPKDATFEELDKLLTQVGGFTRRAPGSGSSHYTYSHPDLKDIITVVKNKPVKPVYVKRALEALCLVVDNLVN